MSIEVEITNFEQVSRLNRIASSPECNEAITVSNSNGCSADARSLLGMMSLNYSENVTLSCASKDILESVVNAIFMK